MKRAASLICLALLLASSSRASAQATTFFGDSDAFPRDLTVPLATEADFLAFIGASTTDTFEGYFPFQPPPGALSFPGVTTTYSTDGSFVGIDTLQDGSFSVSPQQFLSSNLTFDGGTGLPNGANLTTSFVFSDRITAFGAFFINVGDLSNSNVLSITLQDGPAGTPREHLINDGTPFAGRNYDAVFYFGIVDTTPFDRVTINATSDQDGLIFDNISISAVPEPTTYALIGCVGAVVYGGYRYKKRQAAKADVEITA